MRLSKLNHPSATDKCAMVFVPPLAIENEEIEAIFLTSLRNLQMRGAFIMVFTSENYR